MGNIDMKALFSLTYGMYIVSTDLEGRLNGQIANTVMQITSEPVCVATCLNKANLTTDMVAKSGRFSVAILEQDVPMTFIGQFGFKSGRDIDKMHDSGLTPVMVDGQPAFAEAELVLVCRKRCKSEIAPEDILQQEKLDRWYGDKDYNTMYTGEIAAAYRAGK